MDFKISKFVGETNIERNVSLQKQYDGLKKGSRDARQLAGALRMSKGGAPWMDISQQ